MSVGQYGTGHEYVTIIDSAGLETVLPVREGGNVARQSLAATTQVVTVGDNSRRQDLRTPQVIFTDQSGGMGEFQYTETEGILTFTDSDCETRYAGVIALPPAPTTLAGNLLGLSSDVNPIVIEHLGQTNARLLAYPQNTGQQIAGLTAPAYRYVNGTGWSALTLPGLSAGATMSGYAVFRNRFYLTARFSGATNGIFSSADGITWSASAYAVSVDGCVAHDNKFYIWNTANTRLEWNTDPTLGTGWATSGTTFSFQPFEAVVQLFEWRDRAGRTAIYVLTTQRLLWYDDDADALAVFYDFTQQITLSAYPSAHVWRRDGNLYLVFNEPTNANLRDTMLWFSGTTNTTGPNARGGQPLAKRASLLRAVGGLHWLYVWGEGMPLNGQPGRLLALNDQQGWNTVYTPASTTTTLMGGGYARGTAWAVHNNASVIELSLPDTTELPLFASGRTYPTDRTYYHEYAYTDAGTDNMDKQALWVTVQARDMTNANKAQGLPTGCSVVVQYLRDVDSAWTTIGTLTNTDTYPAVLPINNGFGVKFKQIKLRIGLASGTASVTPIVTSVALAFTRRPVQRYAYQIPVDLTPRAFGRLPIQPGPGGLNAAAIRTRLEGYTQPGQMVKLRYGGNTTTGTTPHGTTVGPCQLTLGGSEGPTWGPGQYVLTLTDLSAPASG